MQKKDQGRSVTGNWVRKEDNKESDDKYRVREREELDSKKTPKKDVKKVRKVWKTKQGKGRVEFREQ